MLCADDAEVRGLLPAVSRPVLTYGTTEGVDVRADDLRQEGMQTHFSVVHADRIRRCGSL